MTTRGSRRRQVLKPSERALWRRLPRERDLHEDNRNSITEVLNEDHKFLRFLLLAAGATGLLFLIFAASRVVAVDTVRLAVEEYAVEAVANTLLDSPTEVQFAVQRLGFVSVTLTPKKEQGTVSLGEAVQAVADRLKNLGLHPVEFRLNLKSSFFEEPIYAELWPIDPQVWLEEAFRRKPPLYGGAFDDPPEQIAERLARVLTSCPSQALPVTAKFDFSNIPAELRTFKISDGPLQIGRSNWWRWSAFSRIAKSGEGAPFTSVVNAPIHVLSTRLDRPIRNSTSVHQLRCRDEYPLVFSIGWESPPRRESSYLFERDVWLTSASLKHSVSEAVQSLEKGSYVSTVGDLRIGAFGFMLLTPVLMTLLSCTISLVIRRLALTSNDLLARALWAPNVGSKRRLTPIDGPHLRLCERAARAAFMFFALAAPPLVTAGSSWVAVYPLIIPGSAEWFMEALVKLPLFWLVVLLLAMSLHQMMLAYGFSYPARPASHPSGTG
jgi:hypothetical protein